MALLICMVGLPRSGKSTRVQTIRKDIADHSSRRRVSVVSPDAIRLGLHGQNFVSRAEGFVWAIVKAVVRAQFDYGEEVVILDATCTTRARRDEWVSSEWETVFCWVDTAPAECAERAKSSNREDLIPVIEKMAAEFQPLEQDEARF